MRLLGRSVLLALALVVGRYVVARWLDAPRLEAERITPRHDPGPPPSDGAALGTELRELQAAQEQFRVLRGRYAPSLDSLRRWMPPPPYPAFDVRTNGATGWTAAASRGSTHCLLWARDSALRSVPDAVEGAPWCDDRVRRAPESKVRTVLAPDVPVVPFADAEVQGRFVQHRVDAERRGRMGSDTVVSRWTVRVGGELKSPVAVVGGQVFVGAHGNGEFVALHLRDGSLGFRLRAPNWVHHEPAVTDSTVIVGYGNNENSQLPPPKFGSQPSGLVAYDRRTGVERWRVRTISSVMSTPLLADTVVVSMTSNRIRGLDVRTGRELWHALFPGAAPMGNLLRIGGTAYVGVEKATLCAIRIADGTIHYCVTQPSDGWGAGHSSVASDGTRILMVFDQGVPFTHALLGGWWKRTLETALLLPDRQGLGEQVVVALDAASGRTLWRTPLGIGALRPIGHQAGTPTIVDGIAYVPSPVNGVVAALDVQTGTLRWRTSVNVARGSVAVADGLVLAATRDGGFVVLDATTGALRCRAQLPAMSDRAGLTQTGRTGILTLLDGTIMARPMGEWEQCRLSEPLAPPPRRAIGSR